MQNTVGSFPLAKNALHSPTSILAYSMETIELQQEIKLRMKDRAILSAKFKVL